MSWNSLDSLDSIIALDSLEQYPTTSRGKLGFSLFSQFTSLVFLDIAVADFQLGTISNI